MMEQRASIIKSKQNKLIKFNKFRKQIFIYLNKCNFSDGTTQLLSGCLRDFRNKPFPTRVRIEYYNNILTVMFNNGMTQNTEEYEMCLRAEGVVLPKEGHFGISAATGGLADDHDVYHFLTTSLYQPGEFTEGTQQAPEDSAKLAQEYQDYQKKLDQQKEDYKKEHPEEKKDEFDDWFETDNQRELRQIFQAQSQMTDVMKDLSRKMDEVIGRQERTMGLLSTNAQAGVQQPQIQHQQGVPQHPGAVPQFGSEVRRQDIDIIIQNQNTFISTVRDIKSFIGELQVRTDNILQNQKRQPTAQVQPAGYDVQSMIGEMRDGLNQIKQGITNVHQK